MPEIRDCIFCEFVRNEIGGKVSALGIFGEELRLVGPAPHVLPSFAVLVFVVDREQGSYPLKTTITIPGEPPSQQTYDIVGVPGKVGANVAFTALYQEFKVEGRLTVDVELGTDPPVHKTFGLEVAFRPNEPVPR